MSPVFNGHKQQIDYQKLSGAFLKALRDDKSQRDLSQELGYSFNQVGKWESGVTQVKWDSFVKIADTLDLDLEDKLRSYFGNYKGDFEVEKISDFATNYLGLDSIENQQVQKFIKKWKHKDSSPDLTEFFKMIDLRPAMLIGWLSRFVDCSKIDIIKDQYAEFTRRLDLIAENPNVIFVSEALHVSEYKNLEVHDDEVLAKHASCSIKDMRETLMRLLELNMIFYDGKKYVPGVLDFSFTFLNSKRARCFHKYTFELIGKKYPIDPMSIDRSSVVNASSSSTRVVALSKEAAKKIDKLLYKFHSDTAEIVKNDSGPTDNVQIIAINSLASCFQKKKGNAKSEETIQ